MKQQLMPTKTFSFYQLASRPLLAIAIVLACLSHAPLEHAVAQDTPDNTTFNVSWQQIFNGRDLTGWKADNHPESFSVEQGALKAHGKNGLAHLFYIGDQDSFVRFKDFEIEMVAKGEPNSNSGLFIHTSHAPRPGKFKTKGYLGEGYEVQLNSTEKEKRKTGSLYAVADLEKSPVDETEWFTMRVRVEGKHIRVWLNDELVNDYEEPANPKRPADRIGSVLNPQGGAIAIQAHDPESIFYFKSIRLRVL